MRKLTLNDFNFHEGKFCLKFEDKKIIIEKTINSKYKIILFCEREDCIILSELAKDLDSVIYTSNLFLNYINKKYIENAKDLYYSFYFPQYEKKRGQSEFNPIIKNYILYLENENKILNDIIKNLVDAGYLEKYPYIKKAYKKLHG